MQQQLSFAPSVKKETTERLYTDIRRAYMKWLNKSKDGVRIYSDEYILAVVAKQFYKSPKTVENIVFNRV